MAKKIWWIEGDVFEVLQKRLKPLAKNAVIFGSPPWGGEGQYLQSHLDRITDFLQGRHTLITKSST